MDLATVRDGQLVFPGGAAYRLLVLPACDTMTPALLAKIKQLIESGATVVGPAPQKSPSLVGYPQCDQQIRMLAATVWGNDDISEGVVERKLGLGRIVSGGNLNVALPDESPVHTIERARWIWYPEGDPASAAAPATRYFRRDFPIESNGRIRKAMLEITADNSFEVWVNGRSVSAGNNFHAVSTTDVTSLLAPGRNVLAVAATNGGDSANPAGLIAGLRVEYVDGTTLDVVTDHRWQTARDVSQDWRLKDVVGDPWTSARDLGPSAMSPWQLKPAVDDCPPLYPEYEATARLLEAMNRLPDFETDAAVRYTHRQTDDMDIYFVANREDRAINARCLFRVTERQPQLWDPRTGDVRDLVASSEPGGRSMVRMRFEPYQSFFVVFQGQDTLEGGRRPVTEMFKVPVTVAALEGPWDVSFAPVLGGPEHAQLLGVTGLESKQGPPYQVLLGNRYVSQDV